MKRVDIMAEYNQTYLQKFIPLASGLQQYLGDMYEIVLHDISEPDHSVLFVAGSLTSRPLGAPLTNVVIEEIKKHGNDVKDLIGYVSEHKNGRRFKSSTIFLRDDAGIVVGCFCINMDISVLQNVSDLLNQVLTSFQGGHSNSREIFASDVNEMVDLIVEREINARNIVPEAMSRMDRLEFLLALEEKGIFDVKGSVDHVAQFLGTSVFTVYSYLKEIRTGKHLMETKKLQKGTDRFGPENQ